jgi:hypothetical protein
LDARHETAALAEIGQSVILRETATAMDQERTTMPGQRKRPSSFWSRPVHPAVAALLFLVAGCALVPLVFEEPPIILAGAVCVVPLGAAVAFIPRPARDDPSRLRLATFLAALTAYLAGAGLPIALWLAWSAATLLLTLIAALGLVLAGALAIADDLRSYRHRRSGT